MPGRGKSQGSKQRSRARSGVTPKTVEKIVHHFEKKVFVIGEKSEGDSNMASGIYEHVLKIHLLFTSPSHLNFMYFDM